MEFKVTLVFKYLPAPIPGLKLLDRVREKFNNPDIPAKEVDAGIKYDQLKHDPDKDIYISRIVIDEKLARESGHFETTDEIYLDIEEKRIMEFLNEEYDKKPGKILAYYQLNKQKFLDWWQKQGFPLKISQKSFH
ncbi:MAG: hypothetical protein ACLFQV_07500 [Vulcanimicrobiota bacterium]